MRDNRMGVYSYWRFGPMLLSRIYIISVRMGFAVLPGKCCYRSGGGSLLLHPRIRLTIVVLYCVWNFLKCIPIRRLQSYCPFSRAVPGRLLALRRTLIFEHEKFL